MIPYNSISSCSSLQCDILTRSEPNSHDWDKTIMVLLVVLSWQIAIMMINPIEYCSLYISLLYSSYGD